MTPFAEAADLSVYLLRDFTRPETAQAEVLLGLATAAIQDEIGQTITAATTTASLAGNWGQDLELPEHPVTGVTAVTLDGSTLDGASWRWNGGRILTRRALVPQDGWWFDEDDWSTRQGAGYDFYRFIGFGGWGGPDAIVTVTYTHGGVTVPLFLKALCMDVASRALAGTPGVRQEALGGYSVTYDGAAGVALTEDECRKLRKRYGRTGGTITAGR